MFPKLILAGLLTVDLTLWKEIVKVDAARKYELGVSYEQLDEEASQQDREAALRAYARCAIRAYLKEQHNGQVLGIL